MSNPVQVPHFESLVASATQVTENAPYSTLRAEVDRSVPAGFYIALYDNDTGELATSCSWNSSCEIRVRVPEGESHIFFAYLVEGTPPSSGGPPIPNYGISPGVRVTNSGWAPPVSVVSFVGSATQVTENAPYSTLRVTWDRSLPSGFYTGVYDDTGALAFSCTTSSGCENRVRPGEGAARTYRAYVVEGVPAATGGAVGPLVTSDPVTVTNSGWAPPVSVVSFVASATQVTENAPYSTLRVTWDRSLPSGFYTGVYDDTGALAFSCTTSSGCENRVRPGEGAARTYRAYVVEGVPAATGGAVGPLVTSDPITVTNSGVDPAIDGETDPSIDSVRLLTPVVYQNSVTVRIAVDLNMERLGPHHVGIYDETGARVGSCSPGYSSDFNTCVASDFLVIGEAHTYTAYMTVGMPPASGGPGSAQVGGGVSSTAVINQGWSNAGIEIDSVTLLTPTVYQNSANAQIAVDLNVEDPRWFHIGIYDETGSRVGYCLNNSTFNTCRASDSLVIGEAHTYTVYLTVGMPPASGGPGSAQVGGGVSSTAVINQGWSNAGIEIESVTLLTPTVYQNSANARVAVDLNSEHFTPFEVGVYDETGTRVGRCQQYYGTQSPAYNTCLASDALAVGEAHTYTAYLTVGEPPASGGPGSAQVGEGVSSVAVSNQGWSNAGIEIDSLTVLSPVVYQNSSSVWVAADFNSEHFTPFEVGVYDETGTRVGRCQQYYGTQSPAYNTCLASDHLTAGEAHTYTAYLTVGEPPSSGGPGDAVVFTSNSASVAYSSGPTTPEETAGGSNPSENCSDACEGDPVNTRTGEFWESATDLSVAGVGAPLVVQRSFSTTLKDVDGGLGHGWSLGYRMDLSIAPGATGSSLADASEIQVSQENGATLAFAKQTDGTYSAPARVLATLAQNADGTFTFARRQNQIYEFSATGALVRAEDRNGQGVDLTYDSGDRPVEVSNGRGGTITFVWTGGRIASAVDHTGRTVSYGYDAVGDLTTVTLPDGSTQSYAYDTDHRVVTMTAPDGGQTTNVYDTSHRVVSQTDPLGRELTFAYGTDQTTVTDPMGVDTVYAYDGGQTRSVARAAGTVLEATTYYTYESTNQLAAATDPLGRTTGFGYDARGNRTAVTDPLGRTSTTTYDEWNNPITVTNAAGETTVFVYDGRGNLVSLTNPAGETTTFTVNADGTVASSTDPLGRTTLYTYDAHGFFATTTGPDGAVVTTDYDSRGNLVATTDPRGNVTGGDPGDFTTTFSYDAVGRLLTSTDPLAAIVAQAYDAAGRPTTTTNALGATSTNDYDLAGQLTSVTDALGGETTFTYDGAGRVLTVTDATGATTTNEYDALGRLVAVTDALDRTSRTEYDAGNRVTSTVTPSGARTTYTYDAADQLLSVTDPLGAVTSTTYDPAGRPVKVTDADGRAVTTEYDDAGRPVTVTRADGSTLSWTYDAAGRVLTSTDAAGATTTYTYDAAGRRSTTTDVAGRVTTYTYGPSGLLETVALPGGGTIAYSSDGAGRRTGIDYSDATPDVTYVYDAAGRVTAMADGTGTTEYSYDSLGRVTDVETPRGDVGYGWNGVGLLTELTYPSGEVVERTYDDVGQLTSVTDWTDREFVFDWTDDGQLEDITYPNGVVTSYERDAAGRVTGLTTAAQAGLDLLELAYEYSDAGLMTDRALTQGTATQESAFAWDDLARVDAVTGAGAGDVGFDDAGSVTVLPDGRALSYDVGRQVTSITAPAIGELPAVTTSFGYDARGNRATATADAGPGAGTVTHTFDLATRLTSVTGVDGVATSYAYDGIGLRASASTGGATESYVWDVAAAYPLLLTDADHAYVYGASGTPLAQVALDGGAVDYLHTDALASVVTTTDATGGVTAQADYDLYGVPQPVTGSDPVATVTRFAFAGEYTDPTGYVYLRARYYDPATAQFLSVDPAVDTTGSPYGYTDGNPLQFADPLGLDWLDDAGNWAAAFGDTITFGGTREIRRLINYEVWGEDNDMVDHCSVFYEWGGYGGDIANVGLFITGVGGVVKGLMERLALATQTMKAAEAGTALVPIAGRGALAAEGATGVAANTAGADIAGARFAQTSFSESFSSGGLFSGQTIDDVAGALRSGAMSPKDIPINVVVRDGNTLITNTRSAQALTRAGIPRDAWNVINRTGDSLYEQLLSGQLTRNGLTSAGTDLP
jgi:RHS repeat-associated protein